MKTIRKMIAMSLCMCIMLHTPFVTASANEVNTDNDVVIGSLGEESGYLIPEGSARAAVVPEDMEVGGVPYHLVFPITAGKVYSFLASNKNDKKFTLNSTLVPSTATRMMLWGQLNHSIAEETVNYRIYYGICSYDRESEEYVSVYQQEARSGVYFSPSFKIADELKSGVTYYTYVKNDYPAGTTYVSGSLSLYYS